MHTDALTRAGDAFDRAVASLQPYRGADELLGGSRSAAYPPGSSRQIKLLTRAPFARKASA